MIETTIKPEPSAYSQLADIDDRLAGLDEDLKLLGGEELADRKRVEKAVNGEDATLYKMLQEKVDITESKLSFVRKQKHLLLKARQPLVAEVSRLDQLRYSTAQSDLRKELNQAARKSKPSAEDTVAKWLAKFAYSSGTFPNKVSLDRLFSDAKIKAQSICDGYRKVGDKDCPYGGNRK